jgi:ubiquinone/menaquinone biosynthesis C-methylase UbiE
MNQWNALAGYYDNLVADKGDTIREFLYDPAILNNLDNVEGTIILDAGCGNGYWSRRLMEMGASKVYSIDSSSELINRAKHRTQNSGIYYSVADLSKHLSFKSSIFDIIVSNLVLDYLKNIKKTAVEFSRVLKPNGILLFGVQHPLYHLGYILKQDSGEFVKKYAKPHGYFERIPLQKLTFEQTSLTIFNRTIGDYINPFIACGLKLEKIIEPEYNETILQMHPEYSSKSIIPRFLILKFINE